jgi:hypothetical protein
MTNAPRTCRRQRRSSRVQPKAGSCRSTAGAAGAGRSGLRRRRRARTRQGGGVSEPSGSSQRDGRLGRGRTLALAGDAAERLGTLVPDHLTLFGAPEALNQGRHAVLARQLAKDVGDLVPEKRTRVLEAFGEREDGCFRRREVAEREHGPVAGEKRERAVEQGRLQLGDRRRRQDGRTPRGVSHRRGRRDVVARRRVNRRERPAGMPACGRQHVSL